MAKDASEALGAPEVAGSFVGAKGLTRRSAVGAVGGVVGSVLASAVGGRSGSTPRFGNVGYLAVTADEVAIVKAKTGLIRPSVGSEVVARARRADITSAELDKGALKSALKIDFGDGGEWEFEVQRNYKKTVEQVARELGANVV